jgi:TP901 family phage tail tape measure protein
MARSQDFLIRILGDSSQGVKEIDKFAKKADDLSSLGRAGMVAGGLIAAGVGLAIARYAEFDAAMSNVIATGADAAENQDRLRQAALDAGASTVYSATEAAGAIEELAKAGISADDAIAGGLDASLNLAAAGSIEVADAAGYMATAMTQFSIEGRDATHVADLLAAGAGKAQGGVSDMSQALAQAGLVANATGLTIEETTGGLTAFASAGLLGSDAGTSFKSMLQRLTPQSAAAQRTMDELGISAYDTGGNFIGLSSFAGNLQDSLRRLTPEQRASAMATIFGSDAVRAATILYEQGAEGIDEWTAAVNDQGYAADVARTRLDNLQGDLEALGGAFDTALITAGSGANDVLRSMVQSITGLITVYSELPDEVQQGTLAVAGVSGAVLLAGGIALDAIPRFIGFRDAVKASGLSLKTVAGFAGVAGLAIGGLIAVVGSLAAEQAEARARAESYADALALGGEAAKAAARDIAIAQLQAEPDFWDKLFGTGIQTEAAYDSARKLGLEIDTVTDAWLGNIAAQEQVQDAITAVTGSLEGGADRSRELGISQLEATEAAHNLQRAMDEGNTTVAAGAKLFSEQAEAADESATSSSSAADAYMNASEQASGLTDELIQLIDTINEANGVGQDAVTSNARWRESLAGIAEDVQAQKDAYAEANGTLSGFSLSLDENTAAGSANAAALAAVANDAQAAAQAQFEVDKTTVGGIEAANNYSATLAAQRQAFVDSALGAGYNAEEVQRLADKVFALPSEKQLQILADASRAQAVLDNFIWSNDGRRINLYVDQQSGRQVHGSDLLARASGGPVNGPGTSTSDSILAWLSNGEYVVNAEAYGKNKGLVEWINAGGTLPGFAGGGAVEVLPLTPARPPMIPLASVRSGHAGLSERADRSVSAGSSGLVVGDVTIQLTGDAAPLLRQMDLRATALIEQSDKARVRISKMGKQRS